MYGEPCVETQYGCCPRCWSSRVTCCVACLLLMVQRLSAVCALYLYILVVRTVLPPSFSLINCFSIANFPFVRSLDYIYYIGRPCDLVASSDYPRILRALLVLDWVRSPPCWDFDYIYQNIAKNWAKKGSPNQGRPDEKNPGPSPYPPPPLPPPKKVSIIVSFFFPLKLDMYFPGL